MSAANFIQSAALQCPCVFTYKRTDISQKTPKGKGDASPPVFTYKRSDIVVGDAFCGQRKHFTKKKLTKNTKKILQKNASQVADVEETTDKKNLENTENI